MPRGVRGYYRIESGDLQGIRTAIAAKCAVVAYASIPFFDTAKACGMVTL